MNERLRIISLSVDHLGFSEGLDKAMNYVLNKKASYICFANVHMTVVAYKNKSFLDQVNKANLVFADGKPIAVACRLLYHKKQERISGMDFTPKILAKANEKKLSIFVYGSSSEVISRFESKIKADFPGIHFAGSISPPFRAMTEEETDKDVEKINCSGAQLVFVALGCPKQEQWMAANSSRLKALLLGVGGALPVVAGLEKRAPRWMQNVAMEWLYRLLQQPGRLFTRYFYTNPYFLFLLTREWIKTRFKNNAVSDQK